MSKVNLPSPYRGESTDETVDILMDTVLKLRKELQFLMYNLDEENVPGINSIVEDVAGNYSLIQQNATSITSLVSDVNDNYSLIQQNASDITLKVSTSEYTASIIVSKINGGTAVIDASNIELTGITKIYDPATVSNYLKISGGDAQLYNSQVFYGSLSAYDDIYSSEEIIELYGIRHVGINASNGNCYIDANNTYFTSDVEFDSLHTVDFNNCTVLGLDATATFA
jgi:uncharacterized protein YoxC